jgi:hypothetical protein
MTQLLTKDITRRLLANWPAGDGVRPVVKLFTSDAGATWLIADMDPEDPDRLFGLCDLGMGFPELGYVSLKELSEVRGPLGLHVERDLYFTPTKTLGEYADAARAAGRVVE